MSVVVCWRHRVCALQAPALRAGGGGGGQQQHNGVTDVPPPTAPCPQSSGMSLWDVPLGSHRGLGGGYLLCSEHPLLGRGGLSAAGLHLCVGGSIKVGVPNHLHPRRLPDVLPSTLTEVLLTILGKDSAPHHPIPSNPIPSNPTPSHPHLALPYPYPYPHPYLHPHSIPPHPIPIPPHACSEALPHTPQTAANRIPPRKHPIGVMSLLGLNQP